MKIRQSIGTSRIKIETLVSSAVVYCLGLLQLIKYFGILPLSMVNILIVLLGFLSFVFTIVKKGLYRGNRHVILFVIAYTLFAAISYFYNHNMDLVELFWPFGYMFLGLFFLNFHFTYKVARNTFCFVALAFLFGIIRSGYVDLIVVKFSRNIISVYVLLFFMLALIAAYWEKRPIHMAIPILMFAVCGLAVGRSGVLLGGICILLFVVFDFSKKTAKKRNLIFIPIVLIVLLIIAALVNKIMPSLFSNIILNFRTRGIKSQRYSIWSDYIHKTLGSISNILFGSSISGTAYLDKYSENLHNSFLMLHAKYGIVMFLYVLFYSIRSINSFVKTNNWYFISCWILLLFRMNLDYTNFNDCLDVILIILIFHKYFDTNTANRFRLKNP